MILRVELSKIGIWTSYRAIGEENAAEAAKLVEALGYGAFWLGGSPRLPTVRPLLDATERIVVATGIVNVWQNEPAQLAAERAALARDFPGRLLLGIGIGHPEATSGYAKPLSTMRGFLDGLDAAPQPVPVDERCLAALGPRMLELSAERSRGAIPYFTPVAHTRFAREPVGQARSSRLSWRASSTATPPAPARRRGAMPRSTSGCATTQAICSGSTSPPRTSPAAAQTG